MNPSTMQDSRTLDETDLAIVHALQISPRTSWTLVGNVLGINPVTASRRWERLTEQRLAWVTCLPGPSLWSSHVIAFLELECEPFCLDSLIEELASDQRVASIEVTTGRRDLFLTVFAADLAALGRFVRHRVDELPGVRAVRTVIGTGIYAQGAGWRLDALSPSQQNRLGHDATVPLTGVGKEQAGDRELLLACGADGRSSATELARRVGSSPSTVRRRLDRMTRERVISLRCEVANRISGWPVSTTYWCKVAPDVLQRTARSLASLPEVRLCAAVTGEANLLVTAWLRSPGNSQVFESRLAERFPELRFADRAIAISIPKRIGWRLDDSGRAVSAVPVDLWFDATSDAAAGRAHDV